VEQFLGSNLFRFLFFPLGSAAFGIHVKVVTRNDRYRAFTKEDMAVGLDLMYTAFLIYLLVTSDRGLELTAMRHAVSAPGIDSVKMQDLSARAAILSSSMTFSGWVLFLMFLGLWSASTFVRKLGWKSETELRPVLGIAIPLTAGIIFLMVVMAEASP
jgi:hypothetical protein